MNDELNKKEKAFKSILQQANWEPNTDDVWAQLEGKLPTERKRRRVVPFWWLSGTFIFVLLSLFTGYKLAKLESKQTHKDISVLENNKLTEHNISQSDTRKLSIEDNIEKENIPNEKTTKSNNELKELRISKKSISETNKPIGSFIETKTELNKTSEITNTKVRKTSEQTISALKSIGKTFDPSSQKTAFDKRETTIFDFLPLLNNNLTRQNKYPTIVIDYTSVPFIEPLSKTKTPLFYRLRIGGGKTSFNFHNIESTGEFDQNVFNYEDGKTSFTSAFEIGTYWKGTKLFGGISYGQSIVRYGRNDSSLSLISGTGTNTIIIDENGNSQSIIGTVSIPTETKHDLQWHRRHTYVDLHLGLGRSLFSIGKFSFGLEALVGYNMNTSHSGYYFTDSQVSFQKFVENDQNIYKNKTGFHAAIMGQLSFQLGNVDLSLIPVWRKDLSTITKFENFYQIKNSQLGLQLGISYTPRWK